MAAEGGRLSLAWRDLTEIHPQIVEKFAGVVRELDLSCNNLTDLTPLRDFVKLETLVLDGNKLTSHSKIPRLPALKTLWVNKNRIGNLSIFIDQLVEAVPNLRYLSMMNNDACPNFFNGGSLKQYQDYRKYVISRMRTLTQLDAQPITDRERREAVRMYGDLATSVAFEERERQREEELRIQRQEERRLRDRQEMDRRRKEKIQRREKRKDEALRRAAADGSALGGTASTPALASISATMAASSPSRSTGGAMLPPPPPPPPPSDVVALLLPEIDAVAVAPPAVLAPSISAPAVLAPTAGNHELTDSDDWSSDDGEGDWDE